MLLYVHFFVHAVVQSTLHFFALLHLTCWNQFANCISYGFDDGTLLDCLRNVHRAMVICKVTAFAADSYSYVPFPYFPTFYHSAGQPEFDT